MLFRSIPGFVRVFRCGCTVKTGVIRKLRRKVLQQVIAQLFVRTRADDGLVRLGSDYGGWWAPTAVLRPGASVVSAGVGEDTTFDEALLALGCEVWAVDPTPRAAVHVRARDAEAPFNDRFHFLPVGLWHRREVLRFYAPANPAHVSHSVVNIHQTSTWFLADCWSLNDVMTQAGLATIDVLKLDIEGAENAVLTHILYDRTRPKTICVELDAPLPEGRTIGLLVRLRRSGYRLARMDGWNLLLLYEGPPTHRNRTADARSASAPDIPKAR